MKKILMFASATFLVAGVASGNAMSCEKTIRINDWKDSPNLLDLPMSEVVCYDNGFDPVFRIVFDHNFEGNIIWLGAQGGLITGWSEVGGVKVFYYTQRTNFWTAATKTELQPLEESSLDIKVGNAVYTARWDSVKERYELPPSAMEALSEAGRRNLTVKIRMNSSGIVSEIGSDTVRAFSHLYSLPFTSDISAPPNGKYRTVEQTDIPSNPTTQPAGSFSQRRVDYCLRYGC